MPTQEIKAKTPDITINAIMTNKGNDQNKDVWEDYFNLVEEVPGLDERYPDPMEFLQLIEISPYMELMKLVRADVNALHEPDPLNFIVSGKSSPLEI